MVKKYNLRRVGLKVGAKKFFALNKICLRQDRTKMLFGTSINKWSMLSWSAWAELADCCASGPWVLKLPSTTII